MKPKLPNAATLTYRAAIRRALVAQQARLWARIDRAYVEPRADGYSWSAMRISIGEVDITDQVPNVAFTIEPTNERTDAAADGGIGSEGLALPPNVLTQVGASVAKHATKEVQRQTGFSTSRPMTAAERKATGAKKGAKKLSGITRGDPKVVAKWRDANLKLIKSLQATQVDQLRDVMKTATEQGWHRARLREEIEKRFEVSRSHADLIARDQTLKLNSALTQARHTALGIEEYEWSTSNDERVREEHAALDGKRFRWDDPPEVDGERVHPGEAVQCRCVAAAVLSWLEEE